MNMMGSIYQEYCDSTEESRETKLARETMFKIGQEFCDEATFRKLENAILDYDRVSSAEMFAAGFRCAVLLAMECLTGDLSAQEKFSKLLK